MNKKPNSSVLNIVASDYLYSPLKVQKYSVLTVTEHNLNSKMLEMLSLGVKTIVSMNLHVPKTSLQKGKLKI